MQSSLVVHREVGDGDEVVVSGCGVLIENPRNHRGIMNGTVLLAKKYGQDPHIFERAIQSLPIERDHRVRRIPFGCKSAFSVAKGMSGLTKDNNRAFVVRICLRGFKLDIVDVEPELRCYSLWW